MGQNGLRKWLLPVGILAGFWLIRRYLLPVAIPFLFGALLAMAAEPVVHFAAEKLRWRRGAASAVGVGVTLVLLGALLGLVGALVMRQTVHLTEKLPDVGQTAAQTVQQMRQSLVTAAQKAPTAVRDLLIRTVENAFPETGELAGKLTDRIPKVMGDILAWLPKGTLGIFTGVLSAFMISVRLPKLKAFFACRLPESWRNRYLPMVRQIRGGLWGWLKAQLKLMTLTWLVVGIGLRLMGMELGFVWGGLIALVDAFPVLGTGTVLIPWALVCLVQGNLQRALGLSLTYFAALTLRTVLEPRLVGKQLGLDPLVTLAAFYTGFTLWGFWGMVLSPVLAAVIAAVYRQKEN